MEASLLLANISRAFPAAAPHPMTLRQGQLADQSLSREITDEEWDAEGARDRDIPWDEVPDEQLVECEAAIAHLDEESFVYYLPAFLRFAVRNIGADILGPTGRLMTPIISGVTDRSNYNLGRLQCLNEVQIECVTEFLRFVAIHSRIYASDAEHALRGYWLTPYARQRGLLHEP